MARKPTARKRKIDAKASDVAELEAAGIPCFTIEADSKFGISCMMAVRDIARRMLSREDYKAVETRLREFDLYEEQTRSEQIESSIDAG